TMYVEVVEIAAPTTPYVGIKIKLIITFKQILKMDTYILISGLPLPAISFDKIFSTDNKAIPGNNIFNIRELSLNSDPKKIAVIISDKEIANIAPTIIITKIFLLTIDVS